jgi:hypothetical protein
MGQACTRTVQRVAAATGMIDQAEVVFEDLQDVRGGGVLFALPALLMNGLLKYSDKFFKLRDPYRSRFVLIFDREGYSPEFFQRMWEMRIACQTYQKYPKQKWPAAEFNKYAVKMPHGEIIEMELAERGFLLGDKIWVREIHRKCRSGHQTSVLSTDYQADFTEIAAHMFSRWSQENFFKYMIENFDIDSLTGYKLYGFNETKHVVNPMYRQLDGKVRSLVGILGRKKAKFHDLQINGSELTPKKMEQYEQKKGELREEIEFMQKELESLKKERKQTKKHIPFEELADEEQFYRIAPARKQLLDTVKMIAYRAETAMAQVFCGSAWEGKTIHVLYCGKYTMRI